MTAYYRPSNDTFTIEATNVTAFRQYRYRDSNPGFRHERALDAPPAAGNVRHLQGNR
jgi:hypothetical protein